MAPVGCGIRRPVHVAVERTLGQLGAVVLDREDRHRRRPDLAVLAGPPRAEHDRLVVRQVERRAGLPVLGERDLLFVAAVGPHPPQVHVAVDLAAEHDPLAVRRDRHLGLVPLVVRQPHDVLAVQVGDIQFRALRVLVLAGPVAERHVHVVLCRCPDDALLVREEIRTGVLTAIVDASRDLAVVAENVRQRAADATALGLLRVRVLRLRDEVIIVRRVVRLGRRRYVRNHADRQFLALVDRRTVVRTGAGYCVRIALIVPSRPAGGRVCKGGAREAQYLQYAGKAHDVGLLVDYWSLNGSAFSVTGGVQPGKCSAKRSLRPP